MQFQLFDRQEDLEIEANLGYIVGGQPWLDSETEFICFFKTGHRITLTHAASTGRQRWTNPHQFQTSLPSITSPRAAKIT